MVKPVAAAVAGALISGVAMYSVGAKTAQVDAFQTPALVQTVDGGWVKASEVSYSNALQPAAVRTVEARPVASARPAVIRTVQPAPERVVVREEVAQRDGRTWQKTAMIIGGSTGAGAGIGGIAGGKKGALIGAAIGGGAASIYEATRRR